MLPLAQISRKYEEDYSHRTNSRVYGLIKEERDSLPVADHKDLIIDTVGRNQVTLIKGETGCGKTTQVNDSQHRNYLIICEYRLITSFPIS